MTALQGLVNLLKAPGVGPRLGRRALLLPATLAAAALTCSAAAASPPAPVPYIYNWSGFYIGLNGGFGGGPVSPIYDLNGVAQVGFPGGSQYVDQQHHRMGGFFGGGQAGYNRQFQNNVVLGVESDLQWSDVAAIRGDNTRSDFNISGGFPNSGIVQTEMRVQQNWFGTTRLRAGYAFADRFLAYVTGGIAYSNFSIGNSGSGSELYPNPGPLSSIAGSASSTRIGWAAGAGLEIGLTSRVSFKSEYLFTSYSGLSAPYVDHEGSDPHLTIGTFSSRDLGIHLVRAGLNYRFDDGEPLGGTARLAMPAWTPNWTGVYAGVNGGYGGGKIKPNTSEALLNTIFLFPGTDLDTGAVNTDSKLRSGGFHAGAQLGYNRELPNRLVVGVETDLQWSGIRASSTSAVAGVMLLNPVLPLSSYQSLSVNQNWFGTTRLRLGYRPTEQLLAFVTGGLAYSGFSAGTSRGYYDPIDGPAVETVSGWGGSTRLGWAAGAGVEYALAKGVSFKTEYLYTQYSGFGVKYTGYDTDNTDYFETINGTMSTGTIGIHLIRGGFNWKLGD